MSEPARRGAVWTEDRCAASATAAGARRAQTHRGRAGERHAGPAAGGRPRASGHSPLRLVADGGHLVPQASGRRADTGQDRVRTPPAARRDPPAARRDPMAARQDPLAARQHPLRLTRRGRIVVTVAAVLAIGAASMALAGAAQATGHSGTGSGSGAPAATATLGAPGSGVTKVVIRPGQSLWSVAESYDPNADTRRVIQQILQLNSLTSDQVQPGQTLWVPRG